MTKAEALNILIKMRAWRRWGKEQKEEERPEMPEQKEVDEAFDVCIEMISKSSLPSNLDEAARRYAIPPYMIDIDESHLDEYPYSKEAEMAFKAGAEWMAGQGVSIDGKVIMDFSNPADIINRRLIAKVGDALLEIEPGDVVVQVRKK